MLPGRIGTKQGAVTQQIDAPRDAARQHMHAPQRPAAERHRAAQPGHSQAVRNVLLGFLRAQCVEVKARNHALRQLLQRRARHHRAQLWLANQDDLQQLALVGFQVGEQAQLLQHVGFQVLRLVNDEHRVAPGRMRRQQRGIQGVDVVLDGFHPRHIGLVGHAKLVADGAQQFPHGELGVEDVGHIAVLRDLLQKAAAHRGLARAHLACQQHEAAACIQPIEQVGQGLSVPLAHEKIARVRGNRKRRVLETEERGVHAGKDNAPIHRARPSPKSSDFHEAFTGEEGFTRGVVSRKLSSARQDNVKVGPSIPSIGKSAALGRRLRMSPG